MTPSFLANSTGDPTPNYLTDTTGPMTRDEIKTLACIKFMADLVMQSFCHTVRFN